MTYPNVTKALCLLFLIFSTNMLAQEYTESEVNRLLVKKWYAHMVGEPDAAEMNTSEKTEDVTFKEDGILTIHSKRGGMTQDFDAKWNFDYERNAIIVEIEMQGRKETDTVYVRALSEDELKLTFRNKTVGYKSFPQDPDKVKIKKAPLYVGSVSTIDAEKWTGLYPFQRKTIVDKDGNSETKEAVGVLVLVRQDGNRMIRVSDDGEEFSYVVNVGLSVAGETHYGLETDDPKRAGEFVFREDGSIYFYSDFDFSTTDYLPN